jgi:WD40 repeat protein
LTYEACHEKWISSIRVNPQSENVFLSGGYDGKVKMWDLRNQLEPLSILKQSGEVGKVFATCWNGPNQILSGGSSSAVNVHEIAEK